MFEIGVYIDVNSVYGRSLCVEHGPFLHIQDRHVVEQVRICGLGFPLLLVACVDFAQDGDPPLLEDEE